MSPLPNALTIARVALVPLFVAAFYWPGDAGLWTAFALFVLAGATDAVDGIVARHLDSESPFGRMLDPIADKLMVAAALLMLVADGIVHGLQLIPALVILCREILVSGLREFLATADVSLPVTRVAKAKTTLQMVAIAALILSPVLDRMLPGVAIAAIWGLWAAAALTLYTGIAYFQAGLHYTRREKATRRAAQQQILKSKP
jgi:cardiolipin synthase (CMP-forming)